MKTLGLLMAALLLAFAVGCSSYDCQDACDKLYNECGMVVTVGGGAISLPECVRGCNEETSPENRDKALDCIDDSSCNQSHMSICLQYYNN